MGRGFVNCHFLFLSYSDRQKKIKAFTFFTDTMMKFATFENLVELIYKHVIPKPKNECSSALQLGVSFAGGYIAGVSCAIVSHPADNLVSFLNNAKGATVGEVSIWINLVLDRNVGIKRVVKIFHLLVIVYFSRH